MRTPAVAIFFLAIVILQGCASAPSNEELSPKVLGMPRLKLLSCMGPPNNVAQDGNIEFVTYSHRDSWGGFTYRCDSNFVLTDGKVTQLKITGDEVSGYIDVTSKICRAMVAKCVQ